MDATIDSGAPSDNRSIIGVCVMPLSPTSQITKAIQTQRLGKAGGETYGQIALTRMPLMPTSRAAVLVMPTTPCLLAL